MFPSLPLKYTSKIYGVMIGMGSKTSCFWFQMTEFGVTCDGFQISLMATLILVLTACANEAASSRAGIILNFCMSL